MSLLSCIWQGSANQPNNVADCCQSAHYSLCSLQPHSREHQEEAHQACCRIVNYGKAQLCQRLLGWQRKSGSWWKWKGEWLILMSQSILRKKMEVDHLTVNERGGWDVPLVVDANPIIKNKTSVAANVSSLWRRLSIYTSPMGLPLKKKTKTYMLVMEGDEGMIIPWIVKSMERRIARLNKGTPRNPSLMLENWELLLVTKNGDNQLGTEDKLTQETPESI